MIAKLTIPLAGDPMRNVGDVVEGNEAVRFVEAGFAVPIVAFSAATIERAVRKSKAKEVRTEVADTEPTDDTVSEIVDEVADAITDDDSDD